MEAWPDGRDAATESTLVHGDAVEAWPDGRDAATESTLVDGGGRARAPRPDRAPRARVGSRRRRRPRGDRVVRRARGRTPRGGVGGVRRARRPARGHVGARRRDARRPRCPCRTRWRARAPGLRRVGAARKARRWNARHRRAHVRTRRTPRHRRGARRDGERVVLAFVPADAMERTVVHGLAPELGMARLHADEARATTTESLDPAAWDDALVAGRRALATELVAAGRAMLRLAREHALDARAVRATDRAVPGRPSPPGRDLRGPRGRRCGRRLRLGRARPDDRDARQVPRRPGCHASRPCTASRCWPGSGSPPSTRCTTTSSGSRCSTGCWVVPAPSPRGGRLAPGHAGAARPARPVGGADGAHAARRPARPRRERRRPRRPRLRGPHVHLRRSRRPGRRLGRDAGRGRRRARVPCSR